MPILLRNKYPSLYTIHETIAKIHILWNIVLRNDDPQRWSVKPDVNCTVRSWKFYKLNGFPSNSRHEAYSSEKYSLFHKGGLYYFKVSLSAVFLYVALRFIQVTDFDAFILSLCLNIFFFKYFYDHDGQSKSLDCRTVQYIEACASKTPKTNFGKSTHSKVWSCGSRELKYERSGYCFAQQRVRSRSGVWTIDANWIKCKVANKTVLTNWRSIRFGAVC